jgi:anti-sigma-K factor RskA
MAVMTDERHERLSERDEIEALLPWYVTGKLDAKSRAQVERYMEAHPEVKAHLALAREEADASIASNEAIPSPGPKTLDRLRASIAAAPRRKPLTAVLTELSDRFADWLADLAPPRLALAGAAAALIVAIQAVAIGALVMDRYSAPSYQTAAGDEAPQEGFELLVQFSESATIGEITSLLKELHAGVADGPKAGLYRLRFASAKAGDEEAAIAALKQSGIVTTVLPGR